MDNFSILMSIKPRFTPEIFNSEEKEVELRKSRPSRYTGQPFRIYVYESGKGSVIGHFTCDHILAIDNSLPPELIQELSTLACVTPQEFKEYNPKFAYYIYKRTLYSEPVPYKKFALKHGTGKRPPQSWCYIKRPTFVL